MGDAPSFIDVNIMGREYRVACKAEEREGLLAAVTLVDNKMRDIAQRTKSTIAERVAVMAALNIAHEHLSGGSPAPAVTEILASPETKRRIETMEARLDAVLTPLQKPLL